VVAKSVLAPVLSVVNANHSHQSVSSSIFTTSNPPFCSLKHQLTTYSIRPSRAWKRTRIRATLLESTIRFCVPWRWLDGIARINDESTYGWRIWMLFLFVWVFVWPEAVAEIHASLSRLGQEVFLQPTPSTSVPVAWVQEAAVYILRRHLWEQAGD
jgi:hypothetical protein